MSPLFPEIACLETGKHTVISHCCKHDREACLRDSDRMLTHPQSTPSSVITESGIYGEKHCGSNYMIT